jgi:hypothetical protein
MGLLTLFPLLSLFTGAAYAELRAQDLQSGGAVQSPSLLPTWESARPVAFDSMTFKGAKLNYPIH